MRSRRFWAIIGLPAALCLLSTLALAQPQPAQDPSQPAGQSTQPAGQSVGQPDQPAQRRGLRAGFGRRGGRGMAADPRVQNRTYRFTDTDETLPFAVFVSTKVAKDKKAPLIIALHGLGGNPLSLLRGHALDLAEEGGYILVGPMGYNSGGWYGIPARGGGRRGGRGALPGRGAGAQAAGGTAETDAAKVRELSEKDVLNVLEIVRQEFNVDERRTYLMGHSMGGAGTLHLGVKYARNWAAIAAVAPAAFGLRPGTLAEIKDVPVILVQGDADTAVPVDNTRRWVDKLKELNMTYEYKEIPGGDHGSVISTGMPDIFKFFAQHSKPASN
jgi:predicted esterase